MVTFKVKRSFQEFLIPSAQLFCKFKRKSIPRSRLQETTFSEIITQSSNFWRNYELCPDTWVCVNNSFNNSNICHHDEGGPLYIYECGTRIPICVYGVASHFSRRDDEESILNLDCNDGSFFTRVPIFYRWINGIIGN